MGGLLRFRAARAALALVALALVSRVSEAVPLPEINSQVREREAAAAVFVLFLFSPTPREKKRDGISLVRLPASNFFPRARDNALSPTIRVLLLR